VVKGSPQSVQTPKNVVVLTILLTGKSSMSVLEVKCGFIAKVNIDRAGSPAVEIMNYI
jgi:hypothetical protein